VKKLNQLFLITRAPEAEPTTASALRVMLHRGRPDSEWNIREIPAQSEQGQGEKSCENCGATCSGRVRIVPKNKDVCFNWQPIPAKVEDKNGCRKYRDCPKPPCTEFAESENNEDICWHCGHHKSCHAQGE